MRLSLQIKESVYIIIWSIALFLSNIPICNAQLDATVLEDFTQTMFNPYLLSPAATDTSYSYNIRFNNVNELGLLKNVNKFYIDADKKIKTQNKNAFHHAGIQIRNSKLGDYIYRSNLQLRYSWYTQISRKASVSSGASLGFVNYAFMTTQGGTGGSDFAPDGMIGLSYLRRKFVLSASLQQLFTSVISPVNQDFQLSRLYTLTNTHLFELTHNLNLTSSTTLQYSEEGRFLYCQSFLSDYYDQFLVGVNHFSLRKTSVNLGMKKVPLFNLNSSIIISYSIYHSIIPLPDNSLEIFIGFSK